MNFRLMTRVIGEARALLLPTSAQTRELVLKLGREQQHSILINWMTGKLVYIMEVSSMHNQPAGGLPLKVLT